MKTITAKELRDNLDVIVRRARSGETIRVTYRSQPAFLIVTPEQPPKPAIEPGSRSAMKQLLKRIDARKLPAGKPVFDPDKSIKELYHEMLNNDPKHKY